MKMKFSIISSIFFLLLAYSNHAQSFNWAIKNGNNEIDHIYGVTADVNGNIYTTGSFKGTVDFDPGSGSVLLSAIGESDIFIQKLDASGNLVWAKSMGGSNFDYGIDITVDVNGNVFTTGVFKGTVDFDPGTGTFSLTSNGQYDAFVQKLNVSGNLEWAISFGGSDFDYGRSIAIDPYGNIYITGSFRNSVDFNPGTGSQVFNSAGGEDIFVLKLNFLGNYVTAKTMGGASNDAANSLAIDNLGFIFITGNYSGTVDFDPGNTTVNLTSLGGTDIFIVKLNLSGSLAFAKSIGGNGNDGGIDITTDQYGNIFSTGFFSSTADFDPSGNTFNLVSTGYEDVYVLKLNNVGSFNWAKSFGNSDFNRGNSIFTDNNGDVYSSGFFRGSVDIDPGTGNYTLFSEGYQDIFIQKLTTDGDFLFGMPIGGLGDDYATGVVIDNNQNIIVAGDFQETVDFDPSSGANVLTSAGDFDGFIVKLGTSSCSPNAISPLYLSLTLDDNCSETSWDIKAPSGLVLFSGGPYNCDPNGGGQQANSTITDTLYLFLFECYQFNIYDSNGNGLGASTSGGTDGHWTLKDPYGITLSSGAGNFGFQDSAQFYINGEITSIINSKTQANIHFVVYPNPINNEATIEIITGSNLIDQIIIYDLSGKIVFQKDNISSSKYIFQNNLYDGMYIIGVRSNSKLTYKSIIIN